MPLDVDAETRLNAIAEATIAQAEQHGPRAVTIRTVAARLGGSTTKVTHYVRTRGELMANAVRQAEQMWRTQLAGIASGTTGRERLTTLVEWWTTGTARYDVFRRMWVEMLAMRGSDEAIDRAVRQEAHAERDALVAALVEARIIDPHRRADMLYLLLRGFNISSVEDPQTWPAERGRRAALALLELLPSEPVPTPGPA
ncbi:TetR family transcriptional regulator C-terminal domain-containing protein [Saccharopolyspora sp. K220]|uniref:TetR/AcrR family transcriptional regulator n=1 Tax=Saccharopolyspora soli TaxID=2926618 RepID=UPI001F59423B|nr:TetR family transcriptional regulator C-terminal domain-containing protein [Saccharopolyspora soli]MCI2423845.1 TetR family transcriptional regulator C-terminal domain-containing protein [Saccharopolyspora soli]